MLRPYLPATASRRRYGVCAGGVRGGRIARPSVLLSVPNQIAFVAGS